MQYTDSSMRTKKSMIVYALIATTSLAILVTLITSINPIGKPLLLIFVPVVLGWVFLYALGQCIFILIARRKSKLFSVGYFSLVSVVILLLLLSGMNQLTLRDVLLTVLLAVISGFYFYRSWS